MPEGTRGSGRDLSWLPTTLVVVATLIAVLSTATTWVRTEALDTDQWVNTSVELLDEPEVQQALAGYIVDELYAAIDVTAEVESILPSGLDGLAGPLAGAARGPAVDGVEQLLGRPRFRQAWEKANRAAHQALVAIVRDETRGNVSTGDGAVVLNLGTAIVTVGENLGLSQAALDQIPDDAGQVTVIQSDELASVQDAVKVLDVLSWFLLVLVVGLYALAVFLGRARWRQVLRRVGLGLVGGGLLLLVLRPVVVRWSIDAFVTDPANRSIAQLVGNVFTELMSSMAVTGMVIGLVIICYVAAMGPHRWAVEARQRLGATNNPGLAVALGAVGVLVALAWWSPGQIFDRWITALILVAMIVGAAITLAAAVRSGGPDTVEVDAADAGAPAGSG